MRAAPGVDFINILCANFSYKSALRSITLVMLWLCILFGAKNIGAKDAHKLLITLTTSQVHIVTCDI
jgi:hypothetical protein